MKLLLLISLSLPLLVVGQARPPSRRPCWDEISRNDERRNPDDALPPGGEDPVCDSQGYYQPKQCSGSQCYCVDRQGEKLDSTANRWEADKMMCNCDVAKAKIRGVGQSLTCDKLGNYHHTQCEGTSCYCVHPYTGEKKIGTESNIVDFDRLESRCASEATSSVQPGGCASEAK